MSQKGTKSVKSRIPYATRFEIGLCIALACANITAVAIACEFLKISAVIPAIIAVLIYLAEVSIIDLQHKSNIKMLPRKSIHKLLTEDGSVIIKNSL